MLRFPLPRAALNTKVWVFKSHTYYWKLWEHEPGTSLL